MNYRDNKIFASPSLSSRLSLAALFAALTLLVTQTAFAFPYSGGGCFYCAPYSAGGSLITFNLKANDDDGLPPTPFNFFPDATDSLTGRLCFSGKMNATIVQGTETGEATYELLASDGSDRGICYSNVTKTCDTISSDSIMKSCSAERCTYTVPSLQTLDPLMDLTTLLDGRFKVDTSLPTSGPYDQCASNPDLNICDWEVGFDFTGDIPPNLFPATNTLNGDPVNANVVVYTDEVCVECQPAAYGLVAGTPALKSKSDIIRSCEALALKADWCNNLAQPEPLPGEPRLGPSCETTNAEGQLSIGGMNTAVGDFQKQDVAGATCVSDIGELKTLSECPTEVAIAACGDGPGYLSFPANYEANDEPAYCVDAEGYVDGEMFTFSSAEGGGDATVNMVAAGANPDAPGYAGDNTIPPILPTWTAIISTPDNQANIWDFSETDMFRVAFIHSRNNDDTITGSKVRDVILGGSGADTINGNDGNDVLQGGDNTDILNGDGGDDLLLGYECNGPNADCSSFLNNGSDNDELTGGLGNDCKDGGRGADNYDLVDGGSDAIVLMGNTGNDTIYHFTTDTDTYDPENPGEVDVIVDLTGTATVRFVRGSKKDETPSVCEITTSGNNTIILDGLSQTQCNNTTVLVPGDGDTFPAQCAGHPYTFL
jgi:hypothetical protein